MSNKPKDETDRNADRLLTAMEAAEYLGLLDHKAPSEAVRYLCRRRKLKYVKVGRGLRFRRQWLDQFVERSAVEPL